MVTSPLATGVDPTLAEVDTGTRLWFDGLGRVVPPPSGVSVPLVVAFVETVVLITFSDGVAVCFALLLLPPVVVNGVVLSVSIIVPFALP